MSTVKIQVVSGKEYRNEVRVDNKFAYQFLHPRSEEINHLKKLITALDLDGTIEVVEKERV